MDPLSITVGALSLAKICGVVGVELGLFIKEAGNIGTIVASLQADVKDFETILQLLHDTVNNADVKQWLSTSGRIEPYWESLALSLEDAKRTLEALNDTVTRINRSVSVLDNMRKQMRLKFAAEELNMYQQRILRFKDTVQIILNTTAIWHQVSDKTIPEQVVPRLDETQDMIRRLGLQFNQRMASLQALIQSQVTASPSEATEIPGKEEEFKTLGNLRDCLKGAATVMTSASTIVGRHAHDNSSIIYGSDFGDVFPSDPSESTLNWIRENAIQESDEGYVTNSEISHGNVPQKNFPGIPEERDYDEELELEVMQAYYEQGLQCSKENNLEEAVRSFQNCIDGREAETTPSTRLQNHTTLLVDAMEELSVILLKLRKWDELQKLMKRKLNLQSRLPSPNEDVELADKLLLAQALCMCHDFKEALLYCRSAEVGYRNRGSDGVKDRIDALRLLEMIYQGTNSKKEAEGCDILIKRLKSSQKPAQKKSDPNHMNDGMRAVNPQHNTTTVSRPGRVPNTTRAIPNHSLPDIPNVPESFWKRGEGYVSHPYRPVPPGWISDLESKSPTPRDPEAVQKAGVDDAARRYVPPASNPPPRAAAAAPPLPTHPSAAQEPESPVAPAHSAGVSGPTATALYDYDAAEDNELSFPEGATITGVEFPDEDWWLGSFNSRLGLFPANHVQLDE